MNASPRRSTDGQTWNEFELPSEIASQAVSVASGPVRQLIVTHRPGASTSSLRGSTYAVSQYITSDIISE